MFVPERMFIGELPLGHRPKNVRTTASGLDLRKPAPDLPRGQHKTPYRTLPRLLRLRRYLLAPAYFAYASYFIRYSVMNGTTPGAWTTIPGASIQKAITLSGLTPATIYGFQVQALGVLGYSDWSATETIMCR